MKPKDKVYPTGMEEYYQLQLQPVVSESYLQRSWNRSEARRRPGVRARALKATSYQAFSKSTITRH